MSCIAGYVIKFRVSATIFLSSILQVGIIVFCLQIFVSFFPFFFIAIDIQSQVVYNLFVNFPYVNNPVFYLVRFKLGNGNVDW